AWLVSGLLGMSVFRCLVFVGADSAASSSSSPGEAQKLAAEAAPTRGSGLRTQGLGSELFDDDVAVGVDADIAGDLQGFGRDGLRVQLGVREQRAGSGKRERAARADRDQAVLRFDHVAGAADDQR